MAHLDTAVRSRLHRPFIVTVLGLLFLIFSLAGWVRLGWTVANQDLLEELRAWPGPAYMAAGGALWGVIGLPVALALWTRRRWAPTAAIIAAVVYIFTYWLDRFISQQIGPPPPNSPFALAISLFGMGFLFWALTRRGTRRYFGERESRVERRES